MKTTAYFREQVMRKRPYIRLEWCERALSEYDQRTRQTDGRIRHLLYIDELDKYLRVTTLPDGETVHNAFLDRAFEDNVNVKLHYYKETDSLYIDLAERPGTDSTEVAPGVVVDFDAEGRIVGIDIDNASIVADLQQVVTRELPLAKAS